MFSIHTLRITRGDPFLHIAPPPQALSLKVDVIASASSGLILESNNLLTLVAVMSLGLSVAFLVLTSSPISSSAISCDEFSGWGENSPSASDAIGHNVNSFFTEGSQEALHWPRRGFLRGYSQQRNHLFTVHKSPFFQQKSPSSSNYLLFFNKDIHISISLFPLLLSQLS